jgi:hypothetical protein
MNLPSSTDETDIRPDLDERGLAAHGAAWGRRNHIVLRATSRGPGVPVEVTHPFHGGPPRRVLSGGGTAALSGGKLMLTPATTPAGQETTLVVEF